VRSSLTGFDIFNTVMLQRSLDKRLVVIVESPEDSGVIDPHMNDSEIQTFPGYGKESVLVAAQMFLSRQIIEVIAVVDADLDRYSGRDQRHPPNVVMTEFYDLDADVLSHCSEALGAILANFTDRELRQVYLAEKGVSAHGAIWDMAIAVGEVRYYSVVRQIGLNLREFPLHQILEAYERGAAKDRALALALARTPDAADISASDVEIEVALLPDKQYIASGHDLVSALAALIRMRWGGTAGEKLLAPALRGAIQCQCWRRTVIYRFVRQWATQFNVNAWTCL
jgi:hypothetical protein